MVRVRFAPSPTGFLHIGGLRTALFNLLFARKHNGVFLVRIEDTDTVRSLPQFIDAIMQSLAWADIHSDEPIVKQTDRMALYKEKIAWLLQNDKAYRCFCKANPIANEDDYFKYDGKCRVRKVSSEDLSTPHVIRIKLPLEQSAISFYDSIRGPISFDITQLDDFIIARSDGTPVYNFVVVVDDADMRITHVIRGEDHISNTPKQIVLYQAFGYQIPQFAHLPLILGPTGARLSKRDAATAVSDYQHQGYLPEALCNYLVRLGWAHKDQELFTREEMIDLFSLDAVGKKGAIFDQQKLDWINSIYIREQSAQDLLIFLLRDVEPTLLSSLSWPEAKILAGIDLFKVRVKTGKELAEELKALHDRSTVISVSDAQQWITPKAPEYLKIFLHHIEALSVFDSNALSSIGKQVCEQASIKLVNLAQPLRLALLGKTNGPGVFELIEFLGQEESIRRIQDFVVLTQKR